MAEVDSVHAASRARRRAVLVGVALAVLVGTGLTARWLASAPGNGDAGSEARLPVLGTVPDFALQERSGREVTRAEMAGAVWVANFIFTRCRTLCPLMTRRLAGLQDRLAVGEAPGLRFVSFSVDPGHDTPAVLDGYARQYGASATGWLFLTGERSALYALIRDGFKLGVVQAPGADSDPNALITHSDRFVLVDARSRIRGYYSSGDDAAVERLVQDVQAVRGEG